MIPHCVCAHSALVSWCYSCEADIWCDTCLHNNNRSKTMADIVGVATAYPFCDYTNAATPPSRHSVSPGPSPHSTKRQLQSSQSAARTVSRGRVPTRRSKLRTAQIAPALPWGSRRASACFPGGEAPATTPAWIHSRRMTLEMMNGNVLPIRGSPSHIAKERNRSFHRLPPAPVTHAKFACRRLTQLEPEVPNTDSEAVMVQGYARVLKGMLADSRPLFVVSTKNKNHPNARCSLGQSVGRRHWLDSLRVYRLNRGDRTAIVPGQEPEAKVFVTRWPSPRLPGFLSQRNAGRGRRSTSNVKARDERPQRIPFRGQKFRSTAKIQNLLNYMIQRKS